MHHARNRTTWTTVLSTVVLLLLSPSLWTHPSAVVMASPPLVTGSGVSVGNTARDITVSPSSTLVTNVGNSQNATTQLNGKTLALPPSSGNQVTGIAAGSGSSITNNVGITQRYSDAASASASATTQPESVTNTIGASEVGERGQLTNNIGSTLTTTNHNVLHRDEYHQNVTRLETTNNNYTTLQQHTIEQRIIRDEEPLANRQLIAQLLLALAKVNSPVDSVTIHFAKPPVAPVSAPLQQQRVGPPSTATTTTASARALPLSLLRPPLRAQPQQSQKNTATTVSSDALKGGNPAHAMLSWSLSVSFAAALGGMLVL